MAVGESIKGTSVSTLIVFTIYSFKFKIQATSCSHTFSTPRNVSDEFSNLFTSTNTLPLDTIKAVRIVSKTHILRGAAIMIAEKVTEFLKCLHSV